MDLKHLALLLFPTVASAQTQWGPPQSVPCLPFEPENSIRWPASGHGDPDDFGRAVVLDLDRNDDPDAVVVAGGVAVALFDPVYYEIMAPITALGAVEDIAVLAGAGEEGSDLLLATNADGLVGIGWDEGQFTSPLILARGPWIGARTLHVDDLDDDGADDVIGVTADGQTVVTRVGTGSGLVAGYAYTPGGEVFDAITVEWDANGRALAIVTASGLKVYREGALIDTRVRASSFGCIARVRSPESTTGELLAWARSAFGGGAELVLLDSGTIETCALDFSYCDVGSVVPRAIVAGLYDTDDYDDLLVVHDGNANAVVLRNRGSSNHFNPTDSQDFDVFPLAANPSLYTGVGIPAFAQLDLDGPDDLLLPVEGTGEVVTLRSLPYHRTAASAQQPPLSRIVFARTVEFSPDTDGDENDEGQLRVGFKILEQYETYNRALLKLWKQDEPGDLLLHQSFYARTHGLLSPVANPYQWIAVEESMPSGETWDPQTHFYVELRFQRLNASGGVELQSPKFFGVFTLPDVTTANSFEHECFDYARSQAPGEGYPVYEHDGLTPESPNPLTRDLVGAYVPIDSLPVFDGTPTSDISPGQMASRFDESPTD
jgi:hypothetical protein